jgi:hypothetical protein
MIREIIRVEPLSTYLENWHAPTSAVTRAGLAGPLHRGGLRRGALTPAPAATRLPRRERPRW